MTKKTAAAKRFAEQNGTYIVADSRYALSPRYTLNDGYEKRLGDAFKKATIQHEADLRVVMTLLGVEDQYEDTVETQNKYWRLGGSYTEDFVTKSATQKFAEDLRAAQSAIDGEAALKRLRKAAKTIKKEQSK